MDLSNDLIRMLELMDQPAFFAKDGSILYANPLAEKLQFQAGCKLESILGVQNAIYTESQEALIRLTVSTNGILFQAKVSKLDGCDLFVLEYKDGQSELNALSLAASHLRSPLFNIMNTADSLNGEYGELEEDKRKAHTAHLYKNLYRLQRVVSNMADASRYRKNRTKNKQTVDICALVRELTDKMDAYLQPIGVQMEANIPNQRIYCSIDTELLERAIHNLAANAVHAGASHIQVDLTQKEKAMYLTFSDDGNGVAKEARVHMFSSFLREPGLTGTEQGLGLGMVFIHAAATAHGGTLLVGENKGFFQITLTLSLTQDKTLEVRQNRLIVDYLGGLDRTLTEFSDILPVTTYEK